MKKAQQPENAMSKSADTKNKYEDMIHMPHKQSSTRPHMSVYNRAAQFSPFATLVGYDEAVKETARLTYQKKELSEDAANDISHKLTYLREHLNEQPMVTITFFQYDALKAGGKYMRISAAIRIIDDYAHIVKMADGSEINIDDIAEIECGEFEREVLN